MLDRLSLLRPVAIFTLLCGALALHLAGPARASSVYDEGVFGDLSNDPFAPTPLTFSAGSNVVTGTTSGSDDDFLTITLGAGQSLDAIVLATHNPSLSTSFLGVHSGISYPDFSNASTLGWVEFDSGDATTDLLPAMGASNGNFSGPLGPGAYTFLIAEGSGTPESYSLGFQVSEVPEPATAALTALGLVGLALRRRRAPFRRP